MQDLTITGLDKSYGSARVLRGVDLRLRAGEVHALMGENGAGKSTLIKVLAGIVPASSMALHVDGVRRSLDGPADAAAIGLRFVHQELNIVPSLSVAENILLSRRTPRRFGLAVDWRAMHDRAARALARFGADHIDPRARAGGLSTGDRMLTVLAGLVAADDSAPSVYVMDEPTAALTHAEADRLFAVIAELKARGAAILYVSHRMAEVVELADRVTVLRDGAVVLSCAMADTSRGGIIEAMTGRDVADAYPARTGRPGDAVVLRAERLSVGGASDLTFSVREGEVFGIAGLEGSGQSEILRAVLGDLRPDAGRVVFDGAPGPSSAAGGWASGMAYVPRERRREGLMLGRGIVPNVVLPHLRRLSRGGVLAAPAAETRETVERGAEVRLKYRRPGQSVATLSGGNQQKVVFARALAGTPKLALLDEPTRGVDVGAREDIYGMIRGLGARGAAVLMASSDLPELIGLSDRILVLRDGGQAGIVATGGLTASALLAMIYGDRPVEDAA